ncbi:MAG: hypothetical protein ACRC1K_09830, partial [Planctomycetia bacterium]
GGWKAGPDPGGRPEGDWLTKPIPIDDDAAARVSGLFVSAQGAGRAVLAFDRDKDKAVVECYDLTAAEAKTADSKPAKAAVGPAKSGGVPPIRFEIPFGVDVLALSRDGSRLLTRVTRSKGRLDLWSVPDGKHLGGWRPFAAAEKDDDRFVDAAGFVGPDHVVAYSRGRTLSVWEARVARPLYSVEKYSEHNLSRSMNRFLERLKSLREPNTRLFNAGEPPTMDDYYQESARSLLPAVSPGGKTLVLAHDDRLLFVDALTGEPRGAVRQGARQRRRVRSFGSQVRRHGGTAQQRDVSGRRNGDRRGVGRVPDSRRRRQPPVVRLPAPALGRPMVGRHS